MLEGVVEEEGVDTIGVGEDTGVDGGCAAADGA